MRVWLSFVLVLVVWLPPYISASQSYLLAGTMYRIANSTELVSGGRSAFLYLLSSPRILTHTLHRTSLYRKCILRILTLVAAYLGRQGSSCMRKAESTRSFSYPYEECLSRTLSSLCLLIFTARSSILRSNFRLYRITWNLWRTRWRR